jgi:hypothetical protein
MDNKVKAQPAKGDPHRPVIQFSKGLSDERRQRADWEGRRAGVPKIVAADVSRLKLPPPEFGM